MAPQEAIDGAVPDDLTAFQTHLLAVVADMEGKHGLAIKQEMEEEYGQEVYHGRLYPNLDTLCDKGLVGKGVIDRRTNSYTITTKGQRVLVDYVAWLESRSGD